MTALPFEKVILVNSILASIEGKLSGESTPSPNMAKLRYQSSRETVSLPVSQDTRAEPNASITTSREKTKFLVFMALLYR